MGVLVILAFVQMVLKLIHEGKTLLHAGTPIICWLFTSSGQDMVLLGSSMPFPACLFCIVAVVPGK